MTRYTYTNAEDRYVVSFTRTHDLSDTPMIDSSKGIKRIAARLAHFDGGANSCRLVRAAHAGEDDSEEVTAQSSLCP